jgi:hypothetical protein
MGVLSFSELEVQPDEHFVTVTGHFHLERSAAGGGNAGGFFLLVMEKTPAGWKIVRDDTTNLPSKPPNSSTGNQSVFFLNSSCAFRANMSRTVETWRRPAADVRDIDRSLLSCGIARSLLHRSTV